MPQAHEEGVPAATGARVRGGEWPAVALSFAYFFCVLAAYYVIRPLREQLVAAVGSTQLPWFYGATFIATLILTPVFAWLIARYSRRIVVPLVYLFFIGCLFAFVPLFADPSLIGPTSGTSIRPSACSRSSRWRAPRAHCRARRSPRRW